MTKVAIIDDSLLAISWATQHLAAEGYEVVSHDGSLGISYFLSRAKPDIVLLDVNMPGLNGDAACRLIKQRPATRHIRVVLYSSLKADTLRELAVAAGADGFIVKTNVREQLVNEVRRHLAGGERTIDG